MFETALWEMSSWWAAWICISSFSKSFLKFFNIFSIRKCYLHFIIITFVKFDVFFYLNWFDLLFDLCMRSCDWPFQYFHFQLLDYSVIHLFQPFVTNIKGELRNVRPHSSHACFCLQYKLKKKSLLVYMWHYVYAFCSAFLWHFAATEHWAEQEINWGMNK